MKGRRLESGGREREKDRERERERERGREGERGGGGEREREREREREKEGGRKKRTAILIILSITHQRMTLLPRNSLTHSHSRPHPSLYIPHPIHNKKSDSFIQECVYTS